MMWAILVAWAVIALLASFGARCLYYHADQNPPLRRTEDEEFKDFEKSLIVKHLADYNKNEARN
jgi:hypothetical protein